MLTESIPMEMLGWLAGLKKGLIICVLLQCPCTLHGWTVSNWSRGSIIVSYILSYSNNIIVSRHLIRHSIRISENIDYIFKELIPYYLYLPDQEGQLQELAGVEDGVVALVHHLHTGHLHHIVVLSGGVDDISIPHLGHIRSNKAD